MKDTGIRLNEGDAIGPSRGGRRLARYMRFALVVLAVAILFITFVREQGVIGTWKLSRTEKQLREENEKLRAEKARLQNEVHKLRTSRDLIEKRAREMGLIYPGEVVIDTREDNASKAPAPAKQGGSGRP